MRVVIVVNARSWMFKQNQIFVYIQTFADVIIVI